MRNALQTFAACVLAAAPVACSSRPGDRPQVVAERRRAFDYLMDLEELDSAHVGAIGNLSHPARAFRILLESAEAPRLFGELVELGRVGGRLVGLCGLKVTNPAAFDAARASLRELPAQVGGMQGCLVGDRRPIAEVLADIDSGSLCQAYQGLDEPEAIRAHFRAEGFPPGTGRP